MLAAESEWAFGKTQKSQARLIAPYTSVSADSKKIRVALEFKLAPGWHVYWKNPGDIGYAPKARWTLPQNWKSSDLLFPIPSKFTASGFTGYGYHDQALYLIDLEGPGIEGKFFQAQVDVDYLVCEVQCIPESARLKLSIQRSSQEFSRYARLIDEASANLPTHLSPAIYELQRDSDKLVSLNFKGAQNILDIFPYSPSGKAKIEISKEAENSFQISSPSRLPELELLALWKDGNKSRAGIIEVPAPNTLPPLEDFLLAILFAFLGGLILNLMPCVLPVIGLKTISLVKLGAVQSKQVRQSALWTCLGIVTSFLALSLLIIVLRSAGEQIGWGFQFQSPGFILFMTSVIFVFALNLFGIFEFSLSASSSQTIFKLQRGPFLEGALATLLATPCSAPFLGTALTFALAQPAWLLIVFFIVMGLGLSIPYILLAILPAALRLFPQPGPWMMTLRRFLGYSLLLAVFWLMYVLQQQTSILFMFAVMAVLLGIFISLRELHGRRAWALVVALILSGVFFAERAAIGIPGTQVQSSQFNETALQESLRTGKLLYVVVTADWCLTCKYNEKFVMNSEWFQALLKLYAVEVVVYDWTTRDESIGAFLRAYDRVAIPFSMLISKDKNVVFPELLNRPNVEEHFQKFFEK